MLTIKPIPILNDNYVWLAAPSIAANRSSMSRQEAAVVVDPGDANPVRQYLTDRNLHLDAILVTHRHWDHINGIAELVSAYKCPVFGPRSAAIPQVTHPLNDGDGCRPFSQKNLKHIEFEVLAIPGHTEEHLAYLLNQNGQNRLFSGDTLFSAGCGRLLGGTATQLQQSLHRISRLASSTLIYPTHEYTRANLRFARAIDPTNPALHEREQELDKLQASGTPSLPVTLARELQYNPFLRCQSPEIRTAVAQHFGLSPTNASDDQVIFSKLREWKDTF